MQLPLLPSDWRRHHNSSEVDVVLTKLEVAVRQMIFIVNCESGIEEPTPVPKHSDHSDAMTILMQGAAEVPIF